MIVLQQLRISLVGISLIFLVNSIYAQTGPGGVGNATGINGQPGNKLWLKADAGLAAITTNSPVSFWADQSGNDNNATQYDLSKQPSYQNSLVNGKPAIRFDGLAPASGGDFLMLSIIPAQNNFTTFIVAKTAQTHQIDAESNLYNNTAGILSQRYILGATNGGNTNAGSGLSLGTNGISAYEHANSYMPPLAVYSGQVNNFNNVTLNYASKRPSLFLNGSLVRAGLTSQRTGNILASTCIGGDNVYGNFNGDIAEVILFNQTLNSAQRNIIDNYLSSKYAISTLNDRYSYDGANQYANQVAGIGRDNVSNQHVSASSGIINISSASSLDDGDYLFFGNNGASLQLNNVDAPANIKRLNSVWRTDLTGVPGSVTISIDVSLFSLPDGQTFKLLVDEDGIFSNAVEHNGSTTNGVFTISNPVDLQEGAYFTLGYTYAGESKPVGLNYVPNNCIIHYGSAYTTTLPLVEDGGSMVTGYTLLGTPPTGISINPTTGVLSIANTVDVGIYQLSIQVTNAISTASFDNIYTVRVIPSPPIQVYYISQTISLGNSIVPVLPAASPPNTLVPQNLYSYNILSGSLGGLVLNVNTGEISGTPTTEGIISATIQVAGIAPNSRGARTTLVNFAVLGSAGPAGVGTSTTNKLWLKADAGTSTTIENTLLTSWNDQSGNNNHAIQSSTSVQPTFKAISKNGKPGVRFNRGPYLVTTGYQDNASISIFTVASIEGASTPSNDSRHVLIGAPVHEGNTNYYALIPYGNPYTHMVYVGKIYQGNTGYAATAGSPNTVGTYSIFSGVHNASISSGYAAINGITGSSYKGNRDAGGNGFKATIGRRADLYSSSNSTINEVILYNTTLNDAQRIIIDNYLSAKYNIAISNDKYIAHQTDFIQDVQGIGTTTGLNDNKHSRASNSKGLMLAEINNSLNAANEFLLSGHNAVTNNIVTLNLPAQINSRWERVWYIEKSNGSNVDAKLSFDFSQSGIPAPTNLAAMISNYRLLYRPDITSPFSVVTDGTKPLLAQLENSDQVAFRVVNGTTGGINLNNGYYTLGYAGYRLYINTAYMQKSSYKLSGVNIVGLPIGTNNVFQSGETSSILQLAPAITTDQGTFSIDIEADTQTDPLSIFFDLSTDLISNSTLIRVRYSNGTIETLPSDYYTIDVNTADKIKTITFFQHPSQKSLSSRLIVKTNLVNGIVLPSSQPFIIEGLSGIDATLEIYDVNPSPTIVTKNISDPSLEWTPSTAIAKGTYKFSLTIKQTGKADQVYNGQFISK